MVIEWQDEKLEKPEYDKEVLGWRDCPKCRKDIEHGHNLLATSWNRNGPSIYKYHENRSEYSLINGIYQNLTIHEPYLSPTIPTFWAYINPPSFED